MNAHADFLDMFIAVHRRRRQLLIDSLPPDSIQRRNLEAIQDEVDYGLGIPPSSFHRPEETP